MAKKTTTTNTAAQLEAAAAAQAAVAALPANLRDMPYRDLAKLGKAESDAAAKAKKAKKAKPPTPHLDALNVRHAAGETFAGAPKTTEGKAKAEKAPAPTVAGFKAVQMRSEKHAGLVGTALAKVGGTYVDGLWLMVKRGEEQAVADALAAAGSAVAKVIYDARLFAATYTMVRLAFPKVTGSRRGSADKLIDALNTSVPGRWSVTIKLDGTLTFTVKDEQGEIIVAGGARQVATNDHLWDGTTSAAA